MAFDPNSVSTNIFVTVLTLVMVFALPFADRKICGKHGVSLNDGVSSNPDADKLLHLRKYILIGVFALYLLLVGYVAFFSRSAAADYRVHIALYENLAKSFKIDFGILGFIGSIFRDGLEAALAHVKVQHFENIAQVYMNICMFIPMGYLLPYVFDWFRKHPKRRTVTVSFLASLAIENIQLITKLGYYDIDDIFSNTIGGFIGVLFYMSAAYVLTHPDWRQELQNVRLWRSEAKNYALYPFFRKVRFARVRAFAKHDTEVLDWFVTRMGMYLRRTLRDEEHGRVYFLFEFGKNQLEIICDPSGRVPAGQTVTLACNNSEYLKKRLENFGIPVSDYTADSYTGLRTFSFTAPDNIQIIIIEE